MTKAVLEADGEGAAARVVASVPSPALAVPASLHASLMARLDRLGEAKAVAQIGAAMGREFSHGLLASVARLSEQELNSQLDRLLHSGLMSRQGALPHATYFFKHALVQDAAYGTLLRERRRALHARIAEVLESQFPDVAESQPELLARHFSEGGLIEKAARSWGNAGQRSLAHSALVEAVEHLTRSLGQFAKLPVTPALQREQIKLQIALISPLMHLKGYGAPETKAAAERARLLIEQAKALGDPPDDQLLLFSVLYSFWVANYVAFSGDVVRELATQFLAFAEKEGARVPLMVGHRLMGTSLMLPGDIAHARSHYDQAIALYRPAEHRPLAARFGQDIRVATLCFRSFALWMLGYPLAASNDAERALKDAREADHVATLMLALFHVAFSYILCRDYAAANTLLDQLATLADQKGAVFWKANGMILQGCMFAMTSRAADAVQAITAGITAFRLTGATLWMPIYLSCLARAYAELDKFDDAWRCMDEATTAAETTKEKWCEAEIHRTAGEIVLMSREPDVARAVACFQRSLDVARAQQALSWELRAATSLARLWKDERPRAEAHDLLAPIFNRFTEGLDTLDLIEAKALLAELVC
jgi:predicted ATPase